MRNPAIPVKKFVVRNRTKILVTAIVVATTVAVIERLGIKQHDDFLREKGLYEEFYQQES